MSFNIVTKRSVEKVRQYNSGSRARALLLTSTLDGSGGSKPRTGHFTPICPSPPPNRRETRCPLYIRLCGPQDRSGRMRKTPPHPTPPGFDPRTVQSVVSRYTDCAIPDHNTNSRFTNKTVLRKEDKLTICPKCIFDFKREYCPKVSVCRHVYIRTWTPATQSVS